MEQTLWYKNQAESWMEGLPIGNGRLAAMLWGTDNIDKLSLNHEWLWRGVYCNRESNMVDQEHLTEVRRLLKQGDFFHATSLANCYYGGFGGISAVEASVDSYQPAGDLCFAIDYITSFEKRELDILNAVATVERKTNKSTVQSTFLVHPIFNLIIGRWFSDSSYFSGLLNFTRIKDDYATETTEYYSGGCLYQCKFNQGLSFEVEITVKTDGKQIVRNNGLYIENAHEVIVYVNIATSVNDIKSELRKYPVPQVDFKELLSSHTEVFGSLIKRSTIQIDLTQNSNTTNERIKLIKNGESDPSMLLLFYNYGKYLLASSSICGELPANLQGKWNESLNPPWCSDYHFDINLQMNYWMAETVNMPECVHVLLSFIERSIPSAKISALNLYHCRGVYYPLNTDAWGKCTPEAYGWAVWIGAAPWIAQHFWWHYTYSGDIDFLKSHAYPFLKLVAEFYEDYLLKDEKGIYQIIPSQSPENRFDGTGYWPVSIGISSAMDVQLAYDALNYAIQSAKILNKDEDKIKVWEEILYNLPEFKISDHKILEWEVERVEIEPGHRHLSHLYGLYPSGLFNPIERPKHYIAAINSLKERLAHGGGHTGWSRAWVACLSARAGDGDAVFEHLSELIKEFATVSLLDLHPPGIFQIDGNLGAVAAVNESIIQFWADRVHLLRAIPKEWVKGSATGLKVSGGHCIDVEWNEREVTSVKVTLGYSKQIIIADLANRLTNKDHVKLMDNDILIIGEEGERFNLIF